jgi:hypothetical protein
MARLIRINVVQGGWKHDLYVADTFENRARMRRIEDQPREEARQTLQELISEQEEVETEPILLRMRDE